MTKKTLTILGLGNILLGDEGFGVHFVRWFAGQHPLPPEVEIVEDYDHREGFTRVLSLKLSFGRLSGIDPDAFRFVFSIQAEGTKAEGAQLVFDIRPSLLYCLDCEKEFSSEAFKALCPACAGGNVLLTGGTEDLQLLELDVDQE